MPALRLAFLLLFVCSGGAFGFSSKRPEVSPMPDFERQIPVQLFAGEKVGIAFSDRGVIECFRTGELSEIYYVSSRLILSAKVDGVTVYDDNGEITSGLSEIKCKPRGKSSCVELDRVIYRGFFRVVYDSLSCSLTLYNIIDLEDYLKGVLPAEIGERSKDEYDAAKAQAVASRTYAVWKLISDGEAGKLHPTVADQVYTGRSSELEILNKAVRDTEGEILMFKEGPIAAYYHAVCGGETIPIEKAWPQKDRLPYLVGTKDRDYCRWAKTYSWTESFDLETLSANLKQYFVEKGLASNVNFNEIIDIEFHKDDRTDRVLKMEVFTESNIYIVECDQIRWALGRPSNPGAILPSTRFSARKIINGDLLQSLEISGVGNGHGVGACQCGFIGRAREHQKYDDMLEVYYKGAKLVRIY
ncbi:MAG: SpoIID/LytB domain-containing protein [Candidatus Zixiibacteriota bacterium]|nr:MAG: SpoIID/LytB domain-containing protein [candidate division Zixibacteria bacterium]